MTTEGEPETRLILQLRIGAPPGPLEPLRETRIESAVMPGFDLRALQAIFSRDAIASRHKTKRGESHGFPSRLRIPAPG